MYINDRCIKFISVDFNGILSVQDVMKKTLLEQNAWLKDEKFRAAALHLSAASSSAVEGIYKPFSNDELPLNSVHYKLSVFAELRA